MGDLPRLMMNGVLVLLKGNIYGTISDGLVQYKRVKDYQSGSNRLIMQKAKLTVWNA